MIELHKSYSRGKGDFGWLKTKYSFSFANYRNPKRMGFGTLRVLNDDIVAASRGFDTHEHENFEIVTIVLKGALQHKDSAGHEGIIRPGEVQRISAGSGIAHSEFNASSTEPVELLQIWVQPMKVDLLPLGLVKKEIIVILPISRGPLYFGLHLNFRQNMPGILSCYITLINSARIIIPRLMVTLPAV